MLTQLTHRVPVILKSLMERKLNAPELLIQEHVQVETLFLRLKILNRLSERIPSRKADLRKRRQWVFDEIRKKLERHTAAEEAIFYPECERHEETRALALEAREEHKEIKTLLKDLSGLSIDEEPFEAKLTLLIEDVMHHVREEEENLFPQVRRVFSHGQLTRLGGQLRNFGRRSSRPTRRSAKAAA